MEICNGVDYLDQVKELIIEYTKCLGRDLSFQNIDEELGNPAKKYTAPEGEILVAVEKKNQGENADYDYSEPKTPLCVNTSVCVCNVFAPCKVCRDVHHHHHCNEGQDIRQIKPFVFLHAVHGELRVEQCFHLRSPPATSTVSVSFIFA